MSVTDVQKWTHVFDNNIATRLEIINKAQVEAAKDLLALIEKNTPIGRPELWNWPAPKNYKPGTLKASWTLEIKSEAGIEAEISNDQPYAERVENGWSTQAPEGMMRKSVLSWSSLLKKHLK